MQLELFSKPPIPCAVLAFPLSRRRPLVEGTARTLARLSYDEGRSFWRGHLRDRRREMKASGLSSDCITLELDRYCQAVSREIIILTEYRHRQPEGAA